MAKKQISATAYAKAAHSIYNDPGTVEVDVAKDTPISRTKEGGAHVQAWIWVDNENVSKRTNAAYIAAAKGMYRGSADIGVDSNAEVSRGSEEGAYVSAWVYVSDEDAA